MKRLSLKNILLLLAFVASLFVYFLTIAAAYGGRVDPEINMLPSALTLILPWLAWASLIITVVWFCFRRYVAGAIGVVAVLVSWGPITSASPFSFPKSSSDGATTFSLMTYNMIHGWDQEHLDSTPSERNRTIDFILSKDADIVCVQEVKSLRPEVDVPNLTEEQYKELTARYPYIEGPEGLDTKLLSKYPARFVPGTTYIKEDYDTSRYTFYRVNVKGKELTVVNLHLKSYMLTTQEREVVTEIHSLRTAKQSYRELKGDIRSKLAQGMVNRKNDAAILRRALNRIDGPVIVCGDFNDVPESYAYRLIKGDNLKDAYAETGFGPLVTYNQHLFWFHLDQILYGGDLKALSVKKFSTKLSDHYPLMAEFEFVPSNNK